MARGTLDNAEPDGDFALGMGVAIGMFIALFAVGFLLGVLGHVLKIRLMVGIGVLLVFLATVLLPIIQHLRY